MKRRIEKMLARNVGGPDLIPGQGVFFTMNFLISIREE